MSSDDTKRALDARRRQDHRQRAKPRPRHAWIAERLAKLEQKDALLRQIGFLKDTTPTTEDDDGSDD